MTRFRVANLQDVSAIVELVESAYRGEPSRQGWTTEADLIDGQRTDSVEVSAIIARENNFIMLYEDSHQLLASMHLARKADYAYLGMFAVNPTLQGSGIGKAMLERAEYCVFSEWQCEWLEMSVISQRSDLINWYQKQGYVLSGKKRPFPYGDERYGIPKRNDLVLEVLKKQAEQVELCD